MENIELMILSKASKDVRIFYLSPRDFIRKVIHLELMYPRTMPTTLRSCYVKCIYFEKATKFCEIFTLLLTVCTVVKSKGKISQNFVAFS